VRFAFLALPLIALTGTAALACSCVAPGTREEARAHAREVLKRAVAVVEVDVLAGYDQRLRRGEQVRVRRLLAGRAPKGFQVYRNGPPSSAACELGLNAGERRVLILYPPRTRSWFGTYYGVHGLCSDFLVHRPYLTVTLQEARRLPR
jgi:hypothetical protein